MQLDPNHFKGYDRPGGEANFGFFTSLLARARRPSSGRDRTCIFLRPDGIGDYILFASSLNGFRQLFSQYRLVLIAVREVCELAEASGLVDEMWIWDRHAYEKRGEYWRQWLETLNSVQADVVI